MLKKSLTESALLERASNRLDAPPRTAQAQVRIADLSAKWSAGGSVLPLDRPGAKQRRCALAVADGKFERLYAAGRAAELAGDLLKAKTYYAKLIDNCKDADSHRPEAITA